MKFERYPDGSYRCSGAVIEEVLRRHDYGYEGPRWTVSIHNVYCGGFRTLDQARKAALRILSNVETSQSL